MGYLETIPELAPLYAGADYVEEKTIEGSADLRRFIAGMMQRPAWLGALFTLRKILVRPFGIRQERVEGDELRPEDVPFTPGDKCRGFTVGCGREDQYLTLYADDPHLKAHIVVAAVPLPLGGNRFHVGTIVHFNNWLGPIYFSLILPFHHLVVESMLRKGAKA